MRLTPISQLTIDLSASHPSLTLHLSISLTSIARPHIHPLPYTHTHTHTHTHIYIYIYISASHSSLNPTTVSYLSASHPSLTLHLSINLTSISQPYTNISASYPSLKLTILSPLTFIYQPHIHILVTHPPAIIPFSRRYSASSSVVSPVQTAAQILPLSCIMLCIWLIQFICIALIKGIIW